MASSISTFQFTGLASGIDWRSMVDKLMEIEHRPVDLLQNQKVRAGQQLEAWQGIESVLNSLNQAIDSIKGDAFDKLTAVSSNDNVVTATVSPGALEGIHNITVTQLAMAHTVASDVQPEGPLGFEGTFEVNGIEVTVTSEDTLMDIADKINGAGAGVTSYVVDNRLIMRSNITGSEGEISAEDVSGSVLQQLGVLAPDFGVNIAAGKSYTKDHEPAALYPDDGNAEFTDGVEGSWWVDGKSFGYTHEELGVPDGGTGVLYIHVDLGEVKQISGCKLVTGGSEDSSYCADYLEIWTGIDSVCETFQGSENNANSRNLSVSFSAEARYVTFRITKDLAPRGTSGDWLFIDEGYIYQPGFKNELQPAQDAVLTVNGLTVTRGSNTISDVLPNTTLDLNGTGNASVEIKLDTESVASSIKEVINGYNAILDKVSAATAKGAVLQGNTSCINLQVGLRRLVSDYADRLKDIGIDTDVNGKMRVDNDTLRNALAEGPNSVYAVFFTDAKDGLGDKLLNYVQMWTGRGGILDSTEKGLTKLSDSLQKRIEEMERMLDLRRQTLINQFVAMERILSQLQGQISYLSNQIYGQMSYLS